VDYCCYLISSPAAPKALANFSSNAEGAFKIGQGDTINGVSTDPASARAIAKLEFANSFLEFHLQSNFQEGL